MKIRAALRRAPRFLAASRRRGNKARKGEREKRP
jgi:hypothetical protein